MKAKQAVKQLEQEEFQSNTKRSLDPEPSKAFQFFKTDQKFLPRNKKEKNNEVDDILSALDDIDSNEKPKARTQPNFLSNKNVSLKEDLPQKEDHNPFYDFFEENKDNNLDDISHKAKLNKTADNFNKSNQSINNVPDDIKNRREKLFGLNKESTAKNSEVNSNNQSFSKPNINENNNNDGGIGTVDFGVSRRKNQRNLSSHMNKEGGNSLRPFTSPGLDKKDEQNQDANDYLSRDNLNVNLLGKHPPSQLNFQDDHEDEHLGEYIPSLGSNKANPKPPLSKKLMGPPSQTQFQLSPALSQRNFGDKIESQLDKLSIDNYDGKSKQENDEIGVLAINPKKRTEDLNRNLKNFSELNNRGNLLSTNINSFNNTNLNTFGNMPPILPKENVLELLSNKKSNEIDEIRLHTETVRKNYEDQLKILKDNHAEELEYERKSRMKYSEDIEKQNKRELERIKESYESELKRKEELHKFELDQTRRKYEIEIESLKREIDQQVKLSALAEEIQKHSSKLYDISDKLELQRNQEDYNKIGEVYKREQIIQENERNLQKSLESLENEKRRLDFARQEIDNERNLLRKEYKRLDDLQANIKQLETEKQKDFIVEKKRFDKEKEMLEKERSQFRQEIEFKNKEIEKHQGIFEKEKQELFQMNDKFQENYKSKVKEVEDLRMKLTQQESEIMKRKNLLEKREFDLSKAYDLFNTKNERLRLEQQEFEKEVKKVYEIASEVQKESDFLNTFKRNFDLEKEKLHRKHLELDTYAKALSHEKNGIEREKYDLTTKVKTIDNLRYEVVKGIEQNPDLLTKMNIVAREMEGKSQTIRENNVNKREYLNKNTKENQRNVWNVIRKEETGKFSLNTTQKKGTNDYKPFNIDSYMGSLKKINEENIDNMAYINQEKKELLERQGQN